MFKESDYDSMGPNMNWVWPYLYLKAHPHRHIEEPFKSFLPQCRIIKHFIYQYILYHALLLFSLYNYECMGVKLDAKNGEHDCRMMCTDDIMACKCRKCTWRWRCICDRDGTFVLGMETATFIQLPEIEKIKHYD